MTPTHRILSFWLSIGLTACGGSSEQSNSEGSGQGANAEGRTAAQPPMPAGAQGLTMQQDILEIAHFGDLDREGLFIDFGTRQRMTYTVGHWRTGWGSDGSEGGETFTNAGRMNRVYFPVREPVASTIRIRMKAVGSRRLTPIINGTQPPEGVQMSEGDAGFADYDIPVAANQLHAGENQLQLSFGGVTRVGDEDVAAQVSSIRIIPGRPGDSFRAPDANVLVSNVSVGGTERRSLVLDAPHVYTQHLEIPAGGRLIFGVGLEGTGGSGRAKVVAQSEGGEPVELFAGDLTQRWNDQSIDLSRFAGQVVRLDFVAEGQGRVAWSAVGLMVPPAAHARTSPVKNVVVVLIDTLRASKLRAYNPQSRVRTPVLDRMVQEGTLFTRTQSQENWTKPSVASVLTGLTPMTHGAKTDGAQLPDGVDMVSEAFKRGGFTTASFIANGYVSDRFGFNQGWDHYTNFIRETKNTDAENVFREAGNWIEQHKDQRFFAYVHTIDPHVPYDPPEEYWRMYDPRTDYAGQLRNPRMTGDLLEKAKRTPPAVTFDESDVRRLTALHDGAISYHDFRLGEFFARLQQLGVLDDTLVVITADHGEEFHEHGSWGHGHSVYQELLSVPMIFWRPGTVPAGQRLTQTVSTYSVSPTALEIAGTEGMRGAEARSLLPDLLGQAPEGPQVAFSDFLDDRRVIRAGRWKLILRGINPTFFDLERDPNEQTELNMSRHPIAARYTRVMIGQYLGAADRGHWTLREQRARALEHQSSQLDPTTCAQLQALGYAPDGCGPRATGQTD